MISEAAWRSVEDVTRFRVGAQSEGHPCGLEGGPMPADSETKRGITIESEEGAFDADADAASEAWRDIDSFLSAGLR